MLGSFAVGKTSLVQRFVKSMFSDKYLTTIGVKIDQKMVQYHNQDVNLILWDIHGEDEFQKVQSTYLIGASGYFLVIDGTRKSTFETIFYLQDLAKKAAGEIPFFFFFNKFDLKDEWDICENQLEELNTRNWFFLNVSAKTGYGVENAFFKLTEMMLKDRND